MSNNSKSKKSTNIQNKKNVNNSNKKVTTNKNISNKNNQNKTVTKKVSNNNKVNNTIKKEEIKKEENVIQNSIGFKNIVSSEDKVITIPKEEKDNGKKDKVIKILIISNILVILCIMEFYIFRFVHYYRLENPNIGDNITLAEYITLDKNITVSGSGLYKVDDKYLFIGNEVDNYLYYSGILWRIIEVNDKSIKLITDEVQTSLFWGESLDYSTSYINSWLNKIDGVEHSGIFYNKLNNPDIYLVKSDFCVDMVENASYSCNNVQNDYVGLMTINEYESVKGSESYLNIGSYFWTINTSKNNIWYVMDNGKINDNAFTEQNYYSYGVRPVINLKKDLTLISGDGKKDNPYRIENNYNSLLSNKNIGEYVNFSGYNFRIIDKTSENVILALDGYLKINNEDLYLEFSNYNPNFSLDNGIGYYLNNDFYNTLQKKEYIVPNRWYNGIYVNDYRSVYESFVDANVGLLKVGDFYINDYSDYYLLNRNNNHDLTVYKVVEKNKLFADLIQTKLKVRPAIALRGDIIINSGYGLKENPYIIE